MLFVPCCSFAVQCCCLSASALLLLALFVRFVVRLVARWLCQCIAFYAQLFVFSKALFFARFWVGPVLASDFGPS